MSRFVPQSWSEALLRPVAMASPDGGVYVEFIAPDFRFVFILLLALAAVVAAFRTRRLPVPVVLGAFLVAAFVPWLASTGNGRYFIPMLLLAGPVCIGLVHQLPMTRGFKATLAVVMVLLQSFLLFSIPPWGSWTYVRWGDAPAFPIEISADLMGEPATYVTVSDLSYSVIAPRFHPASRWVNISRQKGRGDASPDALRTQAVLGVGEPLRAVFPAPSAELSSASLAPQLQAALDHLLARQGLSIADAAACRLLPSRGLGESSTTGSGESDAPVPLGFWVCPLAREAKEPPQAETVAARETDAVFAKLERTCPGLFHPGTAETLALPAGAVRGYSTSDVKVYVLNDGTVMYKYFRSLNPEVVGTVQTVLDQGFRMDCTRVQRRRALPWERGL